MTIKVSAVFTDASDLHCYATGWRDALSLARFLRGQGAQVTFT